MMQPRSALDRAEDQLEDAVEQLVQVENMADGLARLVHDGEVGQGAFEPGTWTCSGWARIRLPSVSPMVLTMADDSSMSARVIMLIVSARSSAVLPLGPAGAVRRAMVWPMLHLIAGCRVASLIFWLLTKVPLALPTSIRTVAAVDEAKLGMAARDFGIVQANPVGGIAADAHDRLGQLELLALVGALDDDQTRHARSFGWSSVLPVTYRRIRRTVNAACGFAECEAASGHGEPPPALQAREKAIRPGRFQGRAARRAGWHDPHRHAGAAGRLDVHAHVADVGASACADSQPSQPLQQHVGRGWGAARPPVPARHRSTRRGPGYAAAAA